MKPVQLTSGDMIADRRAEYAEMMFDAGDAAAAAEIYGQALEMAPRWSAGWFRLGEIRERAGDLDGAAQSWRRALSIDPADPLGATLKLQLAGQVANAAIMPSAFVETLFDQYADDFDQALVERLDYAAPDLLADALAGVQADGFAKALDLGCGTGLMGIRLRAVASQLEGCDISGEMLRKAAGKGIYDRLQQADLTMLPPGFCAVSPDLVTAADVFMYLGDLARIFDWVSATLAPGGLFAFTVEAAPDEVELVLLPSRRYAHGEAYVRERLAASGFELETLGRAAIRKDRGLPIEGLVVIARKPAARLGAAVPVGVDKPVPEDAASGEGPALH